MKTAVTPLSEELALRVLVFPFLGGTSRSSGLQIGLHWSIPALLDPRVPRDREWLAQADLLHHTEEQSLGERQQGAGVYSCRGAGVDARAGSPRGHSQAQRGPLQGAVIQAGRPRRRP